MTANKAVDDVVRSFRGTHQCRLDSKGRMSVLKPFLDVYFTRNHVDPPELFLSAGERHTVLVINVYDPVYLTLHKGKSFGQLYSCIVDEQKRIIVPRPLIDYADLKKDVVLSATDEGDYLCIYNALEIEKAEIVVRRANAESRKAA